VERGFRLGRFGWLDVRMWCRKFVTGRTSHEFVQSVDERRDVLTAEFAIILPDDFSDLHLSYGVILRDGLRPDPD
jgi:hypothetical protein